MAKFAIAFVAPTDTNDLRHRVMEAADRESALKAFFAEEAKPFYSDDDQGYHYFKEDFIDEVAKSGSIIELS